jgi:acyl-[acyl-carrier-protein]-phospholipid O-acyltransferase/long-chain-fatty-acid--[acyl-carrier-protein] ligase
MSSSLLLTRRFAPLFWTQFFSAFSDNFLKNSLVFLILFQIGGSAGEALITLAAAVFIAPYFGRPTWRESRKHRRMMTQRL